MSTTGGICNYFYFGKAKKMVKMIYHYIDNYIR